MDYKIKCNGVIIAEFVNKHDRDICMDLLSRYYEDCDFEAIDGV